MRHKDPIALGKRVPGVPRDLETIIHKAIAREPARRYATASAWPTICGGSSTIVPSWPGSRREPSG